jgi:hypothetical protein
MRALAGAAEADRRRPPRCQHPMATGWVGFCPGFPRFLSSQPLRWQGCAIHIRETRRPAGAALRDLSGCLQGPSLCRRGRYGHRKIHGARAGLHPICAGTCLTIQSPGPETRTSSQSAHRRRGRSRGAVDPCSRRPPRRCARADGNRAGETAPRRPATASSPSSGCCSRSRWRRTARPESILANAGVTPQTSTPRSRPAQGPHRRLASAENAYDALKKYARDLTRRRATASSIR